MGELVDGEPMFPGENEIDQLFLIMKTVGPLTTGQEQCLQKNFKGVKFPPIRVRQPLDLRYVGKLGKNELSFLKECLKIDPDERITAEKALQHPYLASLTTQLELSLESTLMGEASVDEYQSRPTQRAEYLRATPRMTIYQDSRVHQSREEQSYMMSRESKNQKSLATFKPSEESRYDRKDICQKVQLQLFPSYPLLKVSVL